MAILKCCVVLCIHNVVMPQGGAESVWPDGRVTMRVRTMLLLNALLVLTYIIFLISFPCSAGTLTDDFQVQRCVNFAAHYLSSSGDFSWPSSNTLPSHLFQHL
jgi:hypothetical protein